MACLALICPTESFCRAMSLLMQDRRGDDACLKMRANPPSAGIIETRQTVLTAVVLVRENIESCGTIACS